MRFTSTGQQWRSPHGVARGSRLAKKGEKKTAHLNGGATLARALMVATT